MRRVSSTRCTSVSISRCASRMRYCWPSPSCAAICSWMRGQLRVAADQRLLEALAARRSTSSATMRRCCTSTAPAQVVGHADADAGGGAHAGAPTHRHAPPAPDRRRPRRSPGRPARPGRPWPARRRAPAPRRSISIPNAATRVSRPMMLLPLASWPSLRDRDLGLELARPAARTSPPRARAGPACCGSSGSGAARAGASAASATQRLSSTATLPVSSEPRRIDRRPDSRSSSASTTGGTLRPIEVGQLDQHRQVHPTQHLGRARPVQHGHRRVERRRAVHVDQQQHPRTLSTSSQALRDLLHQRVHLCAHRRRHRRHRRGSARGWPGRRHHGLGRPPVGDDHDPDHGIAARQLRSPDFGRLDLAGLHVSSDASNRRSPARSDAGPGWLRCTSRCRTDTVETFARRRPSSMARTTERWRPPVQPMATVA